MEFPIRRNKSIEIWQSIRKAVADSFYAIKRNAAHLGKPRNRCCFHVHEASSVSGRKALLLRSVGNLGAGGQPEFSGACVAAEAFAGADVDDASDVMGGAWSEFGGQCAGPANGEDQRSEE